MRALRTLLWTAAFVAAVCSIGQAKTNYAYVSNISANTVSVVNTANNTVVKTISVGDGPWGVAVNQKGNLAYVVNNHNSGTGNSVSVINTATNSLTTTIPVGMVPFDVAFTPNGKVAYVTNANSNTVSVITTATNKVTATVTVQSYPVGLSVTPNGAFVYVANNVSGSVSVISTTAKAVVATVTVGANPIAVPISPDGSTAYAVNSGSNSITVIRTADNSVLNTISVPGGPFGGAVSPDGQWLYVAESSGNAVAVIDTATQTVVATIPSSGANAKPLHIGFTEDSAFAYVANINTNNVDVINTATKSIVNTIAVGSSPIDVGVMGTVHVATTVGGYVGDKGPATSAALEGPTSALIDSAGNVYVSDVFGNRIRKVAATTGTITTYAGTGLCSYNGDNIKATLANICPQGLAWDPSGNMIVADGNGRIRKISNKGIITTIAGNGTFGGPSGNGGPATSADIGQPFYMAYDSAGNLYFASVGQCVVWKVNTSGTATIVAGTGTCGYNGDGIPANTALLNYPRGVVTDSSGNLYIADSQNSRVRMVNPAGTISTFAGNGSPGYCCDGGPATSANIGSPRGLTIYNGSLYITNAGRARVRSVNLGTNVINTYAGSSAGYDGDGNTLTNSRFSVVGPVLFDGSGNPHFPDTFNGRLRKATGGVVNTFAGGYIGDGGKATSAALVLPEAITFDKSGDLYIADEYGNRVRKVTGTTISTVAGTGVNGYSDGSATSATLNGPLGVAVDSSGNVYIADTNNVVIRKVSGGTVSTFATNAGFSYLLQMAMDASNNLYVADGGSCVVWKITQAAVVSVVAGVLGSCGYNGDGVAATAAQLNFPYAVAVDASGNLLIADNGNNRIREVNTGQTISTIAGDGNCNDNGDGGSATAAEICAPYGVAVNHSSGAIYTVDAFLHIREISGGIITAYGGTGIVGFGFTGDGMWPLLTNFEEPIAVAVSPKGVVNVLDDWDHRVRQIK